MGTTNRAFTPSLHRAKMIHTARSNNHLNTYRKKVAEKHEKKTFNVLRVIKRMFNSVVGFFGFGVSSYKSPVADFTTPTHSQYRCGRRADEQIAQRKARRQKRTKLIMTRGYA